MVVADPTVKKVLDDLRKNGGGISKIVEEWREGSEWYRVWSNGLIEQGGRYEHGSSTSQLTVTISLNKVFSNMDYAVVASPQNTNATNSGGQNMNFRIGQSTNSSFLISAYGNSGVDVTNAVNWYAVGN